MLYNELMTRTVTQGALNIRLHGPRGRAACWCWTTPWVGRAGSPHRWRESRRFCRICASSCGREAEQPGRRTARRPAQRGRQTSGSARPRPAFCRTVSRRRLGDGEPRGGPYRGSRGMWVRYGKAGRCRARRWPARSSASPRVRAIWRWRLPRAVVVQNVAREWDRSENSVRWHCQHVYAKLGLSWQAERARVGTALAGVPGLRQE